MATCTTEYDLVQLTRRTGTIEYRFGTIPSMARNIVAQVVLFTRLAKRLATDCNSGAGKHHSFAVRFVY